MRAARILLALCVLAPPAAPAWSQPPLADKLPEETLLYVGWAGRSLTFDGSMFGQMLAEQDTRQLVGAFQAAVSAGLRLDKEDQALLDRLWGMGGIAWEHPCAVGLFDVLPAGEGSPGSGKAVPVGALLVDLEKGRAEFNRELQAMLALGRGKLKITQAAVGDVSYHRFETRAGPCGMGFIGNLFFVTVGPKAPETVQALAGGKAKPLGKRPEFVAAMKEVSGEQVQIALYVDLARAYQVAEKLTGPGPAATGPSVPGRFCRLCKALGLEGATTLAGAANIVDRGLYEKLRVFSPAPHRGVLAPLAGEALPATALAGVPGDADLVLTFRADPLRSLGEIRQVAAAVGRDLGRRMETVLGLARLRLGVDLEKDLLAHLGDHWTLVSAPSLGGLGTGAILSVSLKDEAKFTAALSKCEEALKKGVGELVRGLDVLSIKAGAVEVHYVSGVGEAPKAPLAPAWAVFKGRLYLALFPQVIIAATSGTAEKSLAELPAFAALRNRVPARPSALMYVDAPHLLRQCYGMLLLDWTARANALAAKTGSALRPAILPPLPKLEKYAWPGITAVTADPKGISIESYNSLPGGGLFFLGTPVPMMVAEALISSLHAARIRASRELSADNLRAIGKACRVYAADNKSQFPPDLLRLVDSGALEPAALISPGGERKPQTDEAGKPVGPFDYVYLGAMMTTQSPPDMILAYERPELNDDRCTRVLLVDGRVEWLPVEQFRAQLARTQEYLQEQGK